MMKGNQLFFLALAVLFLSNGQGFAEDLKFVEMAPVDCQSRIIPGSSSNFYSNLDCARKKSWTQNYKESEDFYQNALQKTSNPKEKYTATMELARLYGWQQKYTKAYMTLDSLMLQYPNQPELLALKAKITGWQGYIWSSYRQYKSLEKKYPDDYDVQVGLAKTESYLGFYRASEKRLSKLIAQYPNRPEPRVDYGQTLAWENKLLKSKLSLEESSQQIPDNAQLKSADFDTSAYLNKPNLAVLDSMPGNRILQQRKQDFEASRRPYAELSYAWHNESDQTVTLSHIPMDLDEILTSNRFPATAGFYPTADSELFSTFMPVLYRSGGGIESEQRYTYGLGGVKTWTDRLTSSGWLGVTKFSNGGNVPVYANARIAYRASDYWSPALAFARYPVEDSLLSATGLHPVVGPFANGFVGRVNQNEWWLNNNILLPFNFTTNLNYAIGFDDGANIRDDFFMKFEYNLRRNLFKTFLPHWSSTFYADYESRYWHYAQDRLDTGGADLIVKKFGLPLGSDGISPYGNVKTGGFFSPNHYLYQGFRLGNNGNLFNQRIRYDVSGVIGYQNISRFGTTLATGVNSQINAKITDHLTAFINISYDNLEKFRQFNVYPGVRYQF